MNNLKWGYVAGEILAFLQVHNLLPIIVSFAIGWYLSSVTIANFKMEMKNEQYSFELNVNRKIDEKLGGEKGEVKGTATESAKLSPTPSAKLGKKLLVTP